MLRLVVFDVDGVIADSEPAHFEVFRQILAQQGAELSWDEYRRRYLGYDDRECFGHVLADLGLDSSGQRIEQLCREKQGKFAEYLRDNCIIMPGVAELLEILKSHNIACSICSGAVRSEVEYILAQGRLTRFFRVIVAAEDVSAGKPDPEGYRLSLARINQACSDQPIDPAECLVIEDSTWGIRAAKDAGMHCLAVTSSYPAEQLTAADLVVKDLCAVDFADLKGIVG